MPMILAFRKAISDSILQAHLYGIVTFTSIIAYGSAFEHAVKFCKSTPNLDVGIDLTLVVFE